MWEEEVLGELYDLAECDCFGWHQYELGILLFEKDSTRQEGADWIKTAADNGYAKAKEFIKKPCFEPYL